MVLLPVTVALFVALVVAIAPALVSRASVGVRDTLSPPSVYVIVREPRVLEVVAAVVFFMYPDSRYVPSSTAPAAAIVWAVRVADWVARSIFKPPSWAKDAVPIRSEKPCGTDVTSPIHCAIL